jgi:methionyl-tRNA formyltransferase
MRIAFLGNNRIAVDILRHLIRRKEHIVAVVVHPPWDANPKWRREILRMARSLHCVVVQGQNINHKKVLKTLRRLEPDVALLMNFGYIVQSPFIRLFPAGAINLHTSYLPYHRGQYPNVWSIVEKSPAGISLHQVDAGVDTGPILARCLVPVQITDTGKTLFEKLEVGPIDFFKQVWPLIRQGKIKAKPQRARSGCSHRSRDVEQLDLIDLNKKYRAGDLINILRARTCPPHDGAYFIDGDRRVYMRLDLYSARKQS